MTPLSRDPENIQSEIVASPLQGQTPVAVRSWRMAHPAQACAQMSATVTEWAVHPGTGIATSDIFPCSWSMSHGNFRGFAYVVKTVDGGTAYGVFEVGVPGSP